MSDHAHCRFFHNIHKVKNLNLTLVRKGSHDTEINISNLTRYESSAYGPLEAGSWYLIVKINNLTIRRAKIIVTPRQYYTFILSRRTDNVNIFAYTDDLTAAKMGYAKVRFIHQMDRSYGLDFFLGRKKLTTLKYGEESPFYMVKITDMPKLVICHENKKKALSAPMQLYLFNRVMYNFVLVGREQEPQIIILKYENALNENFQKNFSLDRYMGSWEQIAGIPQSFDRDCVNSRAEYSKLETYVKVLNTCYDSQGEIVRTIEGKVFASNLQQPAALTVKFFDECDVLPAQPNYLVHLTDYDTYSLVGHPDRRSLYLLTRNGTMKISQYRYLLHYAKTLGYPIDQVLLNQQALYP